MPRSDDSTREEERSEDERRAREQPSHAYTLPEVRELPLPVTAGPWEPGW